MVTEMEIAEEKACAYHHVYEALESRDLPRAISAIQQMAKINREDESNIDLLIAFDIKMNDLAAYYKSRSENRFDRFKYLKRREK